METYRTARVVHGILIFIGWMTVGISLVTLAIMFAKYGSLAWVSAGILIAIAISGVLTVAVSQMGLAQLATAENTDKMVHLLRALQQSGPSETRKSPPPLTRPETEAPSALRAPRR